MQQYPQQQMQGTPSQFQYPYPQQQMQAQQAQVKYVGFWGRVLPYLIDGFISGIITGVLAAMHLPPVSGGVIHFLYMIVMEAMFGATIGKFIFGLRVRNVDGSPIGWAAAIIRNLFMSFDISILFTMGRNPLHQRWGDKVAGTVVVKR